MESRIVLIEDNPADIDLFKYAFDKLGYIDIIYDFLDGKSAEDYVLNTANEKPDLIVLDVNLPDKSGLDVLRKIKENPMTRAIPLVVFSSSCLEQDVKKAYEYNANAYLTKPQELEEYLHTIKQLHQFMIELAIKVVK
jgi:CheY-like chemotaxis protein